MIIPDKISEETRFQGIPVSPGVARGSLFVRDVSFEEPDTYSLLESDLDHEFERFEAALVETQSQIKELQASICEKAGGDDARIFDAHLLVLEDRSVLDDVIRTVKERKENIESVFYATMRRYVVSLRDLEDPYLRERAIDIEDVMRRVIRNLAETDDTHQADHTARHKHILLAKDLTPSDTVAIDKALLLGFATEYGSYTSHTAIIARSLGVPAIVGLRKLTDLLHTGQPVLLDGYNGRVIVNPSPETLAEYDELEEKKDILKRQLDNLRDTESKTRDGRMITLSANIEFEHELSLLEASGANGIGLYRTEFFYMDGKELPSEAKQSRNYWRVVEGAKPGGTIIRTLDIGGDKLVNEFDMNEMNPFLGWRGIRVSLERPDLFKTQIRAILRASAAGKVGVMFPMISSLGEVLHAKEVVAECMDELEKEDVPFDRDLEIGAMIEVPSAAIVADQIAREVDFLSIGTNDLIQYTIAVDRVNDRVADLYQPAHPAIIRLLKTIADAGANNDIWVGVCGEMAGDIRFTALLVGLGMEELSVGALQLPQIKHAVQSLNGAECDRLAADVLEMKTPEEILDRCRETALENYPELVT